MCRPGGVLVEDTEPEVESDLRRRAAWLLAMLAVVAVLLVLIMTKVMGGAGSGPSHNRPGALDSAVNPQSTPPTSHSASSPSHASHTRSTSEAPTTPAAGRTTCPGRERCILDGDVGNGLAAINAYRTKHGQPAVDGRVSKQAQQCALHNGSGCSGGWAETFLPNPNGKAAVRKIVEFGHLLDPKVKSFEVGWAYDPGAKMYYFAIIRND